MSEKETRRFVPYDQSHRLRPLLLVTTIVPNGQGQSIVDLNYKSEAAIAVISIGKGTVPPEMKTVLMPTERRDVVFSILREDRWASYKEALTARFSVSKMSKGVAWCVPIDAVAGVSIYKMLSNTRLFEKPINTDKKKGKKKDE